MSRSHTGTPNSEGIGTGGIDLHARLHLVADSSVPPCNASAAPGPTCSLGWKQVVSLLIEGEGALPLGKIPIAVNGQSSSSSSSSSSKRRVRPRHVQNTAGSGTRLADRVPAWFKVMLESVDGVARSISSLDDRVGEHNSSY